MARYFLFLFQDPQKARCAWMCVHVRVCVVNAPTGPAVEKQPIL